MNNRIFLCQSSQKTSSYYWCCGFLATLFLGFITVEVLNRPQNKADATNLPNEVSPNAPDQLRVSTTVKNVVTVQSNHKTHQERLFRFKTLQGKVLLEESESDEKQTLLSDLTTIAWLESRLSVTSQKPDKLVDRLAMIDFLESALTWKTNPVRDEVLTSVETVLRTNNLHGLSVDEKRSVIGDMMELFALLVQEEPIRAQRLLDSVHDSNLKGILDHATRRLGLQTKLNPKGAQ